MLLVNLGTPSAASTRAVRHFLGQFLHDRRVVDISPWLWFPLLHGLILPLRVPRVARRYAHIWMAGRGSPLRVHSEELAAALAQALPERRVALAMRYGQPSIAAALRPLREAGLRRLLVLPLYPQYSTTTSESVFDAVAADLSAWPQRPQLRLVHDYHDDAGWLDAVTQRIAAQRAAAPGERLLLSFHGIPERLIDAGDPYQRQCEASAKAIAARLQLAPDQWAIAYQSRFGRERWLGPATMDVLRDWARQGIRRVDVACPGFAADCLETLEEIAIQNAETFTAAGGASLRYLPALNADAAHVRALAGIIHRHDAGWAE
ncbi:MAG: ferrochelatase [Proteobacteria bacterium]|nr:ferrochelatase [Pseudomonadota bacterium]MBS0463739.1 ferrochelatase [Pseudomonadota bacterium]